MPAMLEKVAPVARNVVGTRTRPCGTTWPSRMTARWASPLLKNPFCAKGWIQSVFLIPSPLASTASRMSVISSAKTAGFPPLEVRTKERRRIAGFGL